MRPRLDGLRLIADPGERHPVLPAQAPLRCIEANQVVFDDIVREFQLIRFGEEQGLAVPARLRELADEIAAISRPHHVRGPGVGGRRAGPRAR